MYFVFILLRTRRRIETFVTTTGLHRYVTNDLVTCIMHITHLVVRKSRFCALAKAVQKLFFSRFSRNQHRRKGMAEGPATLRPVI